MAITAGGGGEGLIIGESDSLRSAQVGNTKLYQNTLLY